jgi:hypothetical protein
MVLAASFLGVLLAGRLARPASASIARASTPNVHASRKSAQKHHPWRVNPNHTTTHTNKPPAGQTADRQPVAGPRGTCARQLKRPSPFPTREARTHRRRQELPRKRASTGGMAEPPTARERNEVSQARRRRERNAECRNTYKGGVMMTRHKESERSKNPEVCRPQKSPFGITGGQLIRISRKCCHVAVAIWRRHSLEWRGLASSRGRALVALRAKGSLPPALHTRLSLRGTDSRYHSNSIVHNIT